MYKEESKKEPLPLRVVLLIMIIETICLTSLNTLSLYVHFSQGVTETVTFMVILGTFYYVYKRKNYSFVYLFIGEEFILKKKSGLNETIALRFYKNEILEINRLDKKNIVIDKSIYMTKRKFYSHFSKENIYYCIYEKNNYKYYVEFRLSEKFYSLLKTTNKKG